MLLPARPSTYGLLIKLPQPPPPPAVAPVGSSRQLSLRNPKITYSFTQPFNFEMPENDRSGSATGSRKRPKSSCRKPPAPQVFIIRASLLAGVVGAPQISGLQASGSLSGAAGPGKPSTAGGQPGDHMESPWEIAFSGLDLYQREALRRYNFQNQHPTELFKTEIGHIRDLRDRCTGGLVTGEDNKAFMTRGRVHSILKKVEKYVKIGDTAIQHHPEIVALIWAGLRMTLQVSWHSPCSAV